MKILAKAFWRKSEEQPKPDVSFVPAMERRRLTKLERATLCVAHAVAPTDEELPIVFASRWGEINTTLDLIRQMHTENEMSPAKFAVSVHNAAPGAFSLFTHNHAPYTAIAARADSLRMGLIEALAMRQKVIFVYAEETTPEFYRADPSAPAETSRAAALLIESTVNDTIPPTLPTTFEELIKL